MKVVNPAAAACPRCGYDQRGVIESWKESCPVSGICAECGLAWQWAELLSTAMNPPQWSIEHPRLRGWSPRRLISTMLMTFRPWRLWRELRMVHPVRPMRLIVFVLTLLAFLHTGFAVQHGVAAWARYRGYLSWGSIPVMPEWEFTLRSAMFPFRDAASGVNWYVSADALLYEFYSGVGRNLRLCEFTILIWLLSPISFALLPVTRRRAKVRWRHIVRITIYTLPVLLLPAAMLLWDQCTSRQSTLQFLRLPRGLLEPMCFAVIPLWFSVCWALANERYLRLPHARWMAALLTLMCWLTAYVVYIIHELAVM